MKLLLANHVVPIRTELDHVVVVRGIVDPDHPPEIVYLSHFGSEGETTIHLLPGYKLPNGTKLPDGTPVPNGTDIFEYLEKTGDFIHIKGMDRFKTCIEPFAVSIDPDRLNTYTEKPLVTGRHPTRKCIEFVLGDHKFFTFLTVPEAIAVDAKIEAMQKAFKERKEAASVARWSDRSSSYPAKRDGGGHGK